jgi:hypothetical protein
LERFFGLRARDFSTNLYMQFQLVRPLMPGSARDIDGGPRRFTGGRIIPR